MTDRLAPRRLSEGWHALVWVVTVAFVTVAYVVAHHELKPRYLKDIRPQVKDAVRSYGVRPNKHTGILELHVGATAYDPDSDALGPLGIGRLPEVRGMLHRASAVVEEYNWGMRKYVEALRSGFFRSPHNPHFMAEIARSTGRDCRDSREGRGPPSEGQVQYRFRVPAESFVRILQEYPNEKTLVAFIDMMANAQPVCVIEGSGVGTWQGGKQAVKNSVSDMCERGRKLRASVTDLFGERYSALVGGCGSTVWSCGPCGGAPTPSDGTSVDGCGKKIETKRCDPAKESAFHKDLRKVVERNVGFFWTSGSFFWWEMMALAVLGVLIRQLVLFAKAYAQRGGAHVWRPRESLRTLMYVAVAPIFSLVIIWILSATNLVVVKPVIGDDWSNATVPIAFLLGLFPTLGYDVLRGLATGLFNRGFKEDDRGRAKPKEIPAMPADMADEHGPSINGLRRRIRHHATAVFR